MKLAAVDIGSNSIHMIIARIDGDGTIEVLEKAKEMVRLGDDLGSAMLSAATQERGVAALKRLKVLADARQVTDIIAVATSAVRDARNGEDFILRVQAETGIDARIISGVEEGRLIYLGTREVYPFGTQRALIVDIGGGSVEFIAADQRREYAIRSLKLGVRRLKDQFLPKQPPAAGDVDALEASVRERIAETVREMKRVGFNLILGTSGTASALVKLGHGMFPQAAGDDPSRVARDVLGRTTDALLRMSPSQIDAIESLDPRRRDAIVHGAVLMRTIVDAFGCDGFRFVDAALREGMIVDYLERHRPELRLEDEIPDPRRRSVLTVVNRLYPSQAHGQTVARIALRLFDQLRLALRLNPRDRELLEYAALLHNVGNAVSRASNHKHSLYIIRNADLAGFTPREKLIMANLARYHRRSTPRPRHPDFMELDVDDRETVRRLCALLRLANALDRGHRGNITDALANIEGERLTLAVIAQDDPALELSAAIEQTENIRELLNLRLEVSPLRPTTNGKSA
jgi:exopolyphosphatase/guanosine-5'-triphosphate,3'-diphosphate pyrophosphatase